MKIRITGTEPLVMHSDALADPANPKTIYVAEISKRRSKTQDDHIELGRREWLGSMYYDADRGPILPAANLEACLVQAAKRRKLGTAFRSALFVEADAALEYDGPRDLDELWEVRGADGAQKFAFRKPVVVQRARLVRCRPVFPEWAAEFTLDYDTDVVDTKTLRLVLADAGKLVGIGDYRPRYGRFTVEER